MTKIICNWTPFTIHDSLDVCFLPLVVSFGFLADCMRRRHTEWYSNTRYAKFNWSTNFNFTSHLSESKPIVRRRHRRLSYLECRYMEHQRRIWKYNAWMYLHFGSDEERLQCEKVNWASETREVLSVKKYLFGSRAARECFIIAHISSTHMSFHVSIRTKTFLNSRRRLLCPLHLSLHSAAVASNIANIDNENSTETRIKSKIWYWHFASSMHLHIKSESYAIWEKKKLWQIWWPKRSRIRTFRVPLAKHWQTDMISDKCRRLRSQRRPFRRACEEPVVW